MITDRELLQRYVQDGSEEAFAEIVRRHVDLVYSAALRQLCGNGSLAEDVTQTVFTSLATKTDTLPRIKHLAAWLYGSTRYTASHTVRTERRRQNREQKAQAIHALCAEGSEDIPAVPPKLIDDVLGKLGEKDRETVLLRFFEGRSFRAIGLAQDVSEDAARMRLARALEKIRAMFARNGITSTTAAVAAALAKQTIAAPANLAATVSATALTGTAALVAPASAKLGIIALMTKTKTIAWVAGGLLILALGYQTYQHREANTQAAGPLPSISDQTATASPSQSLNGNGGASGIDAPLVGELSTGPAPAVTNSLSPQRGWGIALSSYFSPESVDLFSLTDEQLAAIEVQFAELKVRGFEIILAHGEVTRESDDVYVLEAAELTSELTPIEEAVQGTLVAIVGEEKANALREADWKQVQSHFAHFGRYPFNYRVLVERSITEGKGYVNLRTTYFGPLRSSQLSVIRMKDFESEYFPLRALAAKAQ